MIYEKDELIILPWESSVEVNSTCCEMHFN